MDSRNVKTAADARSLVEARGLSHVKLGVVDLDGVIRGKYMARDKFFDALEQGFKFCDVIFGWDSADQLYDKSTFTGWHTAFPAAGEVRDLDFSLWRHQSRRELRCEARTEQIRRQVDFGHALRERART